MIDLKQFLVIHSSEYLELPEIVNWICINCWLEPSFIWESDTLFSARGEHHVWSPEEKGLLYDILSPVCTIQNFVCFAKKKKPSTGSHFSHLQNFLNYYQTSKMLSRIFGSLQFFCQVSKSSVPWQLSFAGSSYFANITMNCMKNFMCSDANKVTKRKIGNSNITVEPLGMDTSLLWTVSSVLQNSHHVF